MERPQKITLGEMRAMGVRGVVIYCQDYTFSHSHAISAEQSKALRFEQQFVCKACGKRGADVRPNFNWSAKPVGASRR